MTICVLFWFSVPFFPESSLQLRQEHTRELDELVQQAGASGGLGGVGAREMVGELNERINILMAENTVMADQVDLACLPICTMVLSAATSPPGKVDSTVVYP